MSPMGIFWRCCLAAAALVQVTELLLNLWQTATTDTTFQQA